MSRTPVSCTENKPSKSWREGGVLCGPCFSLCPDSPSNGWRLGVWTRQTLSPHVGSGHGVSSQTAGRMMLMKAGSYVDFFSNLGFSATVTAHLSISLLWNLSFRFFCHSDVRLPEQRVNHIILRKLVVSL